MTDTYLDLRTRIQTEVNNSAIATASNVNAAIRSAIAFYERQRWWFNEARTNTFTTVASQEFYTSADSAWIPTLFEIDELTITVNGYRYQLERRTWDWIDGRSVSTTHIGQPSDFCYYGNQFRLYPIPDAAYTVRFSGSCPLTALSADADTNAWTQAASAEALIRARAKWDIFLNIAMDDENAAKAAAQMQVEYDNLIAANGRQVSSGKIVPQDF